MRGVCDPVRRFRWVRVLVSGVELDRDDGGVDVRVILGRMIP